MKGDAAFNTHYSISDEDAIVDGEEGEERTYFPLTFVEKTEKQARVRKEKVEGEDAAIGNNEKVVEIAEAFEEM